MGIYSTREVTREWAQMTLMSNIVASSNQQLEDMLFALLGDETLNNYSIVAPTSEGLNER